MSTTLRICLTGFAMLVLAGGVTYGSPAVSLQTESDWTTALGASQVRPMTTLEFSDLQTNNPGFDAPFGGTYVEPELAATTANLYPLEGGETLDGAGLVMGWGDVGQDYTAAWRFVYDLDPNIIGQTLTMTVCPPRFNLANAQINSIGVGFTDAAGLTRTWTWACAAVANPATNTIAWNQNWNVSIGPIVGAQVPAPPPAFGPASATDQATGLTVVPPIIFSAGAGPPWGPPPPGVFNPMMAMWLDAYENGAAAAAPMGLPPGGLPNLALWNWWQNVVVTPEPATLVLLCGAAVPMLLRRRRS